MTMPSRPALRRVFLALLVLSTCVYLASYWGARDGAITALSNVLDELRRLRLSRRKPSSEVTGDGKHST